MEKTSKCVFLMNTVEVLGVQSMPVTGTLKKIAHTYCPAVLNVQW